MKRNWPFYFLLITSWAQAAPFQNLGFDEANTNTTQLMQRLDPFLPPVKGIGPAEDLLPGWQLLQAENPVRVVGYDFVTGELGSIGFFSLRTPALGLQVDGPYLLQILSNAQGLTLNQRGDIPADAQFLTYKSFPGTTMDVFIDGERFPQAVNSSVSPAIALIDISRFAGRNVELSFAPIGGNVGFMDTITFVVPEPRAWMLLGIGGLGFFATWICRRMRGFDPSRISRIFEG